jgi:plasmid stabilization system protein ParE
VLALKRRGAASLNGLQSNLPAAGTGRYQPLALDDLEGIVRHVAEKDLQAANRLGATLLGRAEALAQFPERGGNVRSRPGVKKVVCAPYLIFYRVDDARHCVDVPRFWHGAQNPRSLQLE